MSVVMNAIRGLALKEIAGSRVHAWGAESLLVTRRIGQTAGLLVLTKKSVVCESRDHADPSEE